MASRKEHDKKYDAKRAGLRTRNYATVVYPESAPADWQDRLASMHVEAFVSPLHDQDCNPDGEPKKAHYHVMVTWSAVKTKEQAAASFAEIGGVGAEAVSSPRGMARYLCHLDNPEKAKYLIDDVKCFGGADYLKVISLPSDKYTIMAEIMKFCRDNEVDEYWILCDYAQEYNILWWRFLCDTGSIKDYLASLRHSSGASKDKYVQLLAKYKK